MCPPPRRSIVTITRICMPWGFFANSLTASVLSTLLMIWLSDHRLDSRRWEICPTQSSKYISHRGARFREYSRGWSFTALDKMFCLYLILEFTTSLNAHRLIGTHLSCTFLIYCMLYTHHILCWFWHQFYCETTLILLDKFHFWGCFSLCEIM